MKTILITISRGSIARNLLQNPFYEHLRERHRLVIVTPAATDARFNQTFAHPNVRFIALEEHGHRFGDRLMMFFHRNLIYNGTIDQKNRWGIIGEAKSKRPSRASYLIKRALFKPLSRWGWPKEAARWLDARLLQGGEVANFKTILERENPALVFATNCTGDSEAALIKAARALGILTLGMPKSWDNLSKSSCRAKPDHLVVWSSYMAGEARSLQNFDARRVSIVGIPQFDYYCDASRVWSRERFCAQYGLDPNRAIILFASEGKLFPTDAEITDIIADDIHNDRLCKPAQLLIRPHYGYRDDEKKFAGVATRPWVALDTFNDPSPCFRDAWDYSREFMDRFLNSLYHSDVIIHTCSTLALDATAVGRPVISIRFDGREQKPYRKSIARWYETEYYRAVVATGAMHVVDTPAALQAALNITLTNPASHAIQQEQLTAEFMHKLDGRAGDRLAEMVERMAGDVPLQPNQRDHE